MKGSYKKDSKNAKIALIVLFSIILSISFVYAFGIPTLYCLEKNQLIEFSKCNPNMNDFLCDKSTCQICVKEISNNVFCPESPNSCQNSCIPFEESQEQEQIFPEITLFSPSDLYSSEEEKIIEFIFQVTLPQQIKNCSVLIDNKKVITSTSLIKSGKNRLYYLVKKGSHSWNIECTLRNSPELIESEKRFLGVFDSSSPQDNSTNSTSFDVILLTPEDNFITTGTQAILFKFNLSENINPFSITECSLIMNDLEVSKVINDPPNNTKEISNTLNPGSYIWEIKCIDIINNTYPSAKRNLKILSPPTEEELALIESGSSSGNGGSTNASLIKVNYNVNKSSSKTSDNEDAQQQENLGLIEENENLDEKTEKGFFSSITGAAIGTNTTTRNIGVVLIILFLLIIIYAFVYYKRKK